MSFLSSAKTLEEVMGELPKDHASKKGVETTYYSVVPKDRLENLLFRRELLEAARDNMSLQRELNAVCRRDPLFWVNSFVYTYDPRLGDSTVVPFITYEFQDEALTMMWDAVMTGYDCLFEKSRDMGASWLACLTFLYGWKFREMHSYLMLSRIEDLVDKRDEPDSLFWKLDFVLRYMPVWMRPNLVRSKLTLVNLDNGSTITGASTTSDSGRGGRKTAILLDEFAAVDNGHEMLKSTRDVTKCRLFNSTPKGTGNAFYEIAKKAKLPGSEIRILRMHWTQHPVKSLGKYELSYKPAIGDRIRSPWYDKQCDRAANAQEIAQELDIDYFGSDFQFFEPLLVDRLLAKARPPLYRGELEYSLTDLDPNQFVMRDDGRFWMWRALKGDGSLPKSTYGLGVDISAGTGATPSCISIGDLITGEKIGEYTNSKIEPADFADLTIALAWWLVDSNGVPAYVIFEANGPGQAYMMQMLRRGFRHCYFRTDDSSLRRSAGFKLGWYSTKDSKNAMLGDYKNQLRNDRFINPSMLALQETRHYVYAITGEVVHARAADSIDPSGARQNHADRVIADGLLNKAMVDRPDVAEEETDTPPLGSFAERNAEIENRRHTMAAGKWADRWW